MDWYEATTGYHRRTFDHESDLSSLPFDWQRELAALWRLEADVNNGGYLQFLENWGRESYVYASQALKGIGAVKMADIIDRCQALVDEKFAVGQPYPKIKLRDGFMVDIGPSLPESAVRRISELSYEFMDYPEDIATIGSNHYRKYIEKDDPSTNRMP